MGANQGARHGGSEHQRAYYQAKHSGKKGAQEKFQSIFPRVQTCEIYRSSQTNIGWTEEFCQHTNELAKEDHTHTLPLGRKRERHEKVWTISVNSRETTGPIRSRADFPAAMRRFREVKQEAAAGHQFNPTIRPDLQVRQRQGQQFQRYKDPNTHHAATELSDQATGSAGQPVVLSVDPSTGWKWWPHSISWSSSSWWSSTRWQEW